MIDPLQDKVTDSIAVGGKPETAVSDANGRLFVNIETGNEVAVIDLKTVKVTAHWSIAPAEGPTGLAYDSSHRRLFAGCDKKLVVLNADKGQQLAQLPIGDGCDGVAFDSNTKNIYTANGEGTLTVIQEVTAGRFVVLENIATQKGARTIALDPSTGRLYLPTAVVDDTRKDQRGRPLVVPGSFQVLVIGK